MPNVRKNQDLVRDGDGSDSHQRGALCVVPERVMILRSRRANRSRLISDIGVCFLAVEYRSLWG